MRVLQLNVWARYGPYETRAPRLKRLFAELRPTSSRWRRSTRGRSSRARRTSSSTASATTSRGSGASPKKPSLIVTGARVVGQYADGGAPSDHYGVLAELELDGDRLGHGRGRGLEAWDETKRGLRWD